MQDTEYGTYVHCRSVRINDKDGNHINTKHVFTVPFPEFLHRERFDDTRFTDQHSIMLSRAYENAFNLKAMLEKAEHNESLELLKQHWRGDPVPIKLIDKHSARMRPAGVPRQRIVGAALYVLNCRIVNAHDLLLVCCANYTSKWWRPVPAFEYMYAFLESHGQEGKDVWGPYYLAWRMQNPGVMLLSMPRGIVRYHSNIEETLWENTGGFNYSGDNSWKYQMSDPKGRT